MATNNYDSWEIVGEGYVDVPSPAPVVNSQPDYNNWEVVGTGYVDAPTPEPASWGNELSSIKNRFIEGATGLTDLGVTGLSKAVEGYLKLTGNADAYNQLKDYFPKLGDTSAFMNEQLKDPTVLGKVLGDERAKTQEGRILGEIASFLPGLPLGGGLASTLAGGAASGVAKEVSDNPIVHLASAVLGGMTPGAVGSTKNMVGDFAKNVLPSRIAAKRFQEAAGDPASVVARLEQALTKNIDDPFLPVKTTAELSKNTGLAQLQKGTAKSGGERILGMVGDQLEKRDAIRKQALASLAPDDVAGLSAYEAGNTLRNKFYKKGDTLARTRAGNAFDEVLNDAGNVEIPMAPVQAALKTLKSEHFPTMTVKGEDVEILPGLFQQGQPKTVPVDILSGKLGRIGKNIEQSTETQPLSAIQKLRSKTGQVARDAAAKQGGGEEARIAGGIKDAFTAAENAAVESGILSPEQANKLNKARSLYAERMDKFQKGSSKRILAKSPDGDFRLSGEKVIPEILRAPSNAKKFSQAVGKMPGSKKLIRGQIRQELEGKSADAQKKYILSHKEVLDEVLQPWQAKLLRKNAQDIADEQFVNRATQRAGGGGSDTAPNIASFMKTFLATKVPVVKTVVAVAQHMGINPLELANRAIIKASLDPKEAIKLLRAPTTKTASKILSNYVKDVAKSAGISTVKAGAANRGNTLEKDIRKSFDQEEKKASAGETKVVPAPQKFDSHQSAAEALRDRVIKQESAGNTKAVSIKEAKGLMQLMDATGREMHKKLKISEPYDPFDPEQNVKIGTAYLAEQLKTFGGDQRLALAAYNAGPGRLKDAIGAAGSASWQKVRRHLPAETRNYVTKILKLEEV